MSGRGKGRRAALPERGFTPQARVVDELVVRFTPEDRSTPTVEFGFATMPVSEELRRAFAAAFAQRCQPGSGMRATTTAQKAFRRLKHFADYLAGLLRPPLRPADLAPAHLDGWLRHRGALHSAGRELSQLQQSLRKLRGITAEFAARLTEPTERRPSTTTSSYSRAEFDRIMNTARSTVRRCATRIRANQKLLAAWRRGEVDKTTDKQAWRRGEILDHVDRLGDVPRHADGRAVNQVFRLGGVNDHVYCLHLGPDDAAAFVVLLVGLTGQNRGTVVKAPAAHHRPDGYDGPIPTAIVELDKPRRAALRHMDVPLVGLPAWITGTDENAEDGEREDPLDLHTPFGVYMLLHELTAAARRITGTDKVVTWWASKGGGGVGRGFRTGLHSDRVLDWAAGQDLTITPPITPGSGGAEQDGPTRLPVLLPQLRLTYLQLHQKPVAQSEATLVNDYLLRDRGNIDDYRRVVADTLHKEVAKAKTGAALHTLPAADVEQARTDPATVAARHGLDATTLSKLVTGELDTVVAGCTDNLGGHQTQAGKPCQASFMLCLSCPCARALPHHLPLQVAVHDALLDRRADTTPLRWAQRFADPHARLADLLDRAGSAAVTDARAGLTAQQRGLAQRFLNREMDLS